MKKIGFEIIKKNKRLTDFSGIKELVIANKVKNVPSSLKETQNEHNKQLGFFYD